MSLILQKVQDLDWEQVKGLLRERKVQYGLVAGLVGVYVLRKLFSRSKYRLPPGPRGWPLLGNFIEVSTTSKTKIMFKKWKQQYGDIFTVYLGPMPCVILNTPDVIKEAFITKGHEFDGRLKLPSMDVFTDGCKDIAMAQPGPVWKLQRQIAHAAMRKHASAQNLERNLENAMESFVTAVSRKPDGIVDITEEMFKMLYNFLASVCFGRQFEYDDQWLADFVKVYKDTLDKAGEGLISDFFPALKFLDKGKIAAFQQFVDSFNEMFNAEYNEHEKTFDPNQPRDLVDELLLQIKKQKESPDANPVLAQLEQAHFNQILFDVFFAGTDTSRVTLAITIALLVEYPEIQAKLQKELDGVLGETGRVTLKNKDQLPYTNAVVHEAMRFETVVPVGVPHTTTCDTSLRGYTIPKDTMVMADVHGVHHDPANFENPDDFNPDRWIDENGKFQYMPYKFIPFSMGPRVCVGESLARVDLHVFTAMLFHKYEFKPIDDKPFKLPLKDIQMSVDTMPYKLRVIERH